MRGLFLIKDGDNYMEFHNYDDIPMSVDNLIKFEPEYPPEPHTEEQHEMIATYNDKLKELMKRERM